MSANPKIMLPLTFEAFNALDVLVNSELPEISHALARLPPDAKKVRANMLRFVSRLNHARQLLESARPLGYREAIKAEYEKDFAA